MSSVEAQALEPVHVMIDGVSIATYVLGPEEDCEGDVVICHGTPWSAQVWAQVARRLSEHYRVFLWDMPGYGRSSMSADVPIDLRSQIARCAQLFSHWNLDRPYVIAHDIGGAVALGAHVLDDVEFGGVFLWDIVTLEPWGSPFFRLVAENPDAFAGLPSELHAAVVREYIAGAGRHRSTADQVEALAEPWLGSAGQAAFYRQIASLGSDDTGPIVERLSSVRCAVRIGWGVEDPWIPLEQAYRLQKLLPDSPSVVELEGVGHLAPIEDPSGVCLAFREWLRDLGPE